MKRICIRSSTEPHVSQFAMENGSQLRKPDVIGCLQAKCMLVLKSVRKVQALQVSGGEQRTKTGGHDPCLSSSTGTTPSKLGITTLLAGHTNNPEDGTPYPTTGRQGSNHASLYCISREIWRRQILAEAMMFHRMRKWELDPLKAFVDFMGPVAFYCYTLCAVPEISRPYALAFGFRLDIQG